MDALGGPISRDVVEVMACASLVLVFGKLFLAIYSVAELTVCGTTGMVRWRRVMLQLYRQLECFRGLGLLF